MSEQPHRYEIRIYWSEEDAAYLAEVPDLPGCITDGATPSLAVSNAEQAIALWLETARECDHTIPPPHPEPHVRLT